MISILSDYWCWQVKLTYSPGAVINGGLACESSPTQHWTVCQRHSSLYLSPTPIPFFDIIQHVQWSHQTLFCTQILASSGYEDILPHLMTTFFYIYIVLQNSLTICESPRDTCYLMWQIMWKQLFLYTVFTSPNMSRVRGNNTVQKWLFVRICSYFHHYKYTFTSQDFLLLVKIWIVTWKSWLSMLIINT